MDSLLEKIRNIGIVPVVKIDDASKAVDLAKALSAGGIPAAEITFRTAAAEDSIKAIRKACPDMLVGAGTVINLDFAKKAVAAGAQFIVSPGFNPAVVDYCIAQKVLIIPGINNPTGIESGLEKGLTLFKFFPAEASGGVEMIDALSGPFPNCFFMPTGGITPNNLSDYARRKNILAIGGTWMVKSDLIDKNNWAEITRISAEAVNAVQGFAFAHLGINQQNATQATETAKAFSAFGLPIKDGNSSLFCGTEIEVIKSPFKGTCGHIAIKTWNVDRALAYLAHFGYKADLTTAKYEGEQGKSPLSVVYLDSEPGGFAIHLLRAK